MTHDDICKAVKKITDTYGERNPFRLCEDLDIILLFQALGTENNSVKGFYFESHRIKTITVNSDLSEELQRIITAHELGHAVLHRTEKVHSFNELWLFDEAEVMEREANLFAAELLVDDKELLEILREGSTFFEAAARLMVPIEILEFKLRLIRSKGYDIREAPMRAKSKFLKSCANTK